MKQGRPRKLRISKKARTKAWGASARGARSPLQIRAATRREAVRSRYSWRNSIVRKRRYG